MEHEDAVRSWSRRYEEGDTPWDLGAPHPDLAGRLPELRGLVRPGARRVFVPGCGRGHDAEALARAGYEVVAMDLVPGLNSRVATRLAPLGGRFEWADALLHAPQERYDLIWEHTFFCALEPDERPRWGAMARRVLAREGILAGVAFPVGMPEQWVGPPWGMTVDDLTAALGPPFRLLKDEPVSHPAERRTWRERWFVYKKVGD